MTLTINVKKFNNMFSKYSEQKFDILNKYKVFYTKEEIEDVVNSSDEVKKKNEFFVAKKNNIKVLYKIEGGKKKIITFYPVK
ncbi:hypothetical protein C0584_02765 [Candidatus Parcubacteria bacterium]|nr:MAG: hypothetical protein C0584_02765 [Candidatus Parcubacteria bacterium]